MCWGKHLTAWELSQLQMLFLPTRSLSSSWICPQLCGLWHRVPASGLPRCFRHMSTALRKRSGEKKYNSFPSKWRYKNPRGTIYHLIGTFFFMVVEHVYHQICLWHPGSICGFCNFDERACRTVIWCLLAQLWSLTYSPKATDRGMAIPAPEQGLQAISSGRRHEGREAGSGIPGRTCARLLLISSAPSFIRWPRRS